MKLTGRSFCLILSFFLFLTACSGEEDKNIISEKELVSLLTDMEIAEAYTSSSGAMTSTQNRKIGEGVLKAHGVSREQLDSTLAWYGRNADIYYELLRKVDKNIEKKQQLLARQEGVELEESNKSDLWTGLRGARISENTLKKGIVFDINSPELDKGDVLEWSFRTSAEMQGNALLGVDYTDGTTHLQRIPRQGDRRLSIRLQTDSSRKVKRIFGYFQETDMSNLPIWCDSIRLLRTGLDSLTYYEISRQKFLGVPSLRKVSHEDSVRTLSGVSSEISEVGRSVNSASSRPHGESGSQGRSDVSLAKLIEQTTGKKEKVQTGVQRNMNRNELRKR